ncbi:MAG TPA: PKD domain-containing protein [Chthoniobacterales bacterium]|nr:PKD domain-containing protein [Chthoniobacterales bacterium]
MKSFGRFIPAALLLACATTLRADCSLTSTGNVPLPDLGPGTYRGYLGGLYPNGSNQRPPAHDAAGRAIANQIQPLNAAGQPDATNGKIVFISVGMSNTTQEFASKGSTAFKPRADLDPGKNPQLVIVDGAQGGQDATMWLDPNAATWATVDQRLVAAGVTTSQVQVAWVKQALASPRNYGAFPAHAQALQADLETIVRNLKTRYPNIRIAYLSSRTRAYTNDASTLNPEPFAYESGFSVQWTIADQINGLGNLNFDASKGTVVAPYLAWGPYLWTDGTNPRSDGFTWLCPDVVNDFTHPSNSGVTKVADQLLALFKTDPTATPWFLKKRAARQPPQVTAAASPALGTTNLSVQFNSSATDPDGTISAYIWTFDDGTYSYAQNPLKVFSAPGSYNVHLTVTDNDGDFTTVTVPVNAGAAPLLNISTRMQVGLVDNVLIGGFIVQGTGQKKLILRAIGPSLAALGVPGPLADPALELHDASGAVIARNDNWQTTQIGGVITASQATDIQGSGIAPSNPAESATIVSLAAGNYTVIVRGANNSSGMGLVEAYDLDGAAPAKLANISTRGLVQTAEKVLIGGLIIGGPDSAKIIARALGPSLTQAGLTGVLTDPTLELRDNNGALVRSNDDWRSDQQLQIEATGIPPTNNLEAAIVATLAPGNYTAIVAGKNGGTGIGLVEFYKL